jgi:hypothetical protein
MRTTSMVSHRFRNRVLVATLVSAGALAVGLGSGEARVAAGAPCKPGRTFFCHGHVLLRVGGHTFKYGPARCIVLAVQVHVSSGDPAAAPSKPYFDLVATAVKKRIVARITFHLAGRLEVVDAAATTKVKVSPNGKSGTFKGRTSFTGKTASGSFSCK